MFLLDGYGRVFFARRSFRQHRVCTHPQGVWRSRYDTIASNHPTKVRDPKSKMAGNKPPSGPYQPKEDSHVRFATPPWRPHSLSHLAIAANTPRQTCRLPSPPRTNKHPNTYNTRLMPSPSAFTLRQLRRFLLRHHPLLPPTPPLRQSHLSNLSLPGRLSLRQRGREDQGVQVFRRYMEGRVG